MPKDSIGGANQGFGQLTNRCRMRRQLSQCGHAVALALGSNGRVEDGRGSFSHAATLRFPSPLIEPDVPISGIRLSDVKHLTLGRRIGADA
jgi:hypothetical protein